jgi:hypothetical protein
VPKLNHGDPPAVLSAGPLLWRTRPGHRYLQRAPSRRTRPVAGWPRRSAWQTWVPAHPGRCPGCPPVHAGSLRRRNEPSKDVPLSTSGGPAPDDPPQYLIKLCSRVPSGPMIQSRSAGPPCFLGRCRHPGRESSGQPPPPPGMCPSALPQRPQKGWQRYTDGPRGPLGWSDDPVRVGWRVLFVYPPVERGDSNPPTPR